MKISFDTLNGNQNVDKRTTSQQTAHSSRTERNSGYRVDISGTVTDNNAYGGQGKTAEDVMLDAANQDVALQRDYMAVMSNCVSEEDFARLQEEGFDPGSADLGTVVTIVDRIKAALAQGGTQIIGYTDTLDGDTLSAITGNEGLAEEIAGQMARYDMPPTRENVEAVCRAAEEAGELEELSDGAVKYMVQNGMEPTVRNMYVAQHANAADADRQAKGYYAVETGYYAQKAATPDWERLMPQIESVVEEAGLDPNDGAVIEEAEWLVQKGVELTPDNLSLLHKIKSVRIPVAPEEAVKAAVTALADGRSAGNAIPGKTKSDLQEAVGLKEDVDGISGEAADLAASEGRTLNIRSLKAAQIRLNQNAGLKEGLITNTDARRRLEEIRLQMTVTANLRLLKSGYSIETAPMEELIERLKEAAEEETAVLFPDEDAQNGAQKASLYRTTLETADYLAGAPAAVVGRVAQACADTTLAGLRTEASALRSAYEKAGESYEALMTAPRADLGDSIRKAFRNVDDILEDMGLETTQDNRRAVRILGYNSMEITEENFSAVRAADAQIQDVLKNMTPSSVLQMIRDGKNPLAMSMGELRQYFGERRQDPGQEHEKYSKFLYKLEKNNDIGENEKEAYIGVYRMLRQLQKDDGSAVGSLVEQGAELTFSNLMTALRSGKRAGMDYKVDDSFGGTQKAETGKSSITGQIEAGYPSDEASRIRYAACLAEEIYGGITPERIRALVQGGDVTLEQAAEAFRKTQEDERLQQDYRKEEAGNYRQAGKVGDTELETLLRYHQPVTADNLFAAQTMLGSRGRMWKELSGREAKASPEKAKKLETAAEKLSDGFDSAEETKQAYEEFAAAAGEVLEEAVYEEGVRSVDVRELNLLYKQVSFHAGMAKEENYEVPVTINGELTSINLKMIRSEGAQSRVAVTMETERLGQIAGEFRVRDGQVSGYAAADKKEGAVFLKKAAETMEKRLSEAGFTAGRINVIESGALSLDSFERRELSGLRDEENAAGKDRTSDTALYRVAKTFLTAVKTA